MNFEEIKETVKEKAGDALVFIDEKTKPVRTWVGDHKIVITGAALGLMAGVIDSRAEKRGYKRGLSKGLGENILQDYNKRVIGNAIDKIDKAGDDGIIFQNDDDGREILVKKVSDVKKF